VVDSRPTVPDPTTVRPCVAVLPRHIVHNHGAGRG
jgi:hypothetical protein